MENFLSDRSTNLSTRQRMLGCYVYPRLLYGTEAATRTAQVTKRLEACEMWFRERMLQSPWTQTVTNAEGLNRAGTERVLMEINKKRKTEYFGHVIGGSKYEFLRWMWYPEKNWWPEEHEKEKTLIRHEMAFKELKVYSGQPNNLDCMFEKISSKTITLQ